MPVARLGRALAIAAVAAALVRAIATVWFSSEVVAIAPNTEIAAPALTDRVVLVVIDGLRYDTALESDLMPELQAIARAGASGMSLASRVTMTGLGVRTLGTGTSPALADILLEVRLPPVTFDNVFATLRARGGHVAWFGNPAWRELFGAFIDLDPHIDRELELMSQADNVWAADPVIVRRAIRMLARRDWQLCIVHVGGLDNASHRFTPFGDQFRAKARAVDADIARLVAAAGERTTVIVTSDHGTSDRGHHGSGEAITRRTPLVLTGTAIAHGHTFEAAQTDVVPTIAALLGLPIPAPSEGEILLAALDVPATTAAALHDANVHQLQRYATAYAAEHDLEAPHVEPSAAGMRAVGEWIEDVRTSAVVVPMLWAIAFVLVALALFGVPTLLATAPIPIAAWSFVVAPRSELVAGLAVIAAAAAAFAALRDLPRRWSRIGASLAAIAMIEVLIAAWKLNHRFIEMKMHDVYAVAHVSDLGFALVLTGVAAIAGAVVMRRRWPDSPWAVIGVVFAAAALADSLAIPAALAIGIAAVASTVERRELVPVAIASALGVAAIAVAQRDVLAHVPLAAAGPLVLAAVGCVLGATTLQGRIAIAGLGAAATIVRLAGDPAIPYRATLAAIVVASVVLARVLRGERPLALVGWCCTIAVAMLSRPSQLPGLVAWVSLAALVGRSERIAASTERAALAATLLAIAFRFACFAIFEGEFEFSHVEVWVGYQGNPTTGVAFGAMVIAAKFALPLVIGTALVTARMTPMARRAAVAWLVAFLCLRIAHITIGMTIAHGTFYSPYLDSGQLVFTTLMLASVPLLLAWLAAIGVWRAATS